MTPLVAAALAAASCLPLPPAADHITAADLVRGWPELAAVSDTVLGFAPAPGVRRVFTAGELERIRLRLHMDGAPPAALCIARPAAPLEAARLLEAMRPSLPDARIEILDFSRAPAPPGPVRFPRELLQTSGIWKGYIEYAPGRRFAIWARVRALVQVTRVVAVEALPAGRPIAQSQVKLETIETGPGPVLAAQSIDEVAGRIARRSIPAGQPVAREQTAEAPEVVRGQNVRVEVNEGAMHLQTQGLAEADGRHGERVVVRNLASGRRFLARVAGQGLVVAGNNDGRKP